MMCDSVHILSINSLPDSFKHNGWPHQPPFFCFASHRRRHTRHTLLFVLWKNMRLEEILGMSEAWSLIRSGTPEVWLPWTEQERLSLFTQATGRDLRAGQASRTTICDTMSPGISGKGSAKVPILAIVPFTKRDNYPQAQDRQSHQASRSGIEEENLDDVRKDNPAR